MGKVKTVCFYSWELGAVLALALALLLWYLPCEIDPVYERISDALPVFSGCLQPNDYLTKGKRLFEGKLFGPESFAIDTKGSVYTGLGDGRIVKISEGQIVNITRFRKGGYSRQCGDPASRQECGRPLGIDFQPNGRLYVLETYHGLYSVDVSSGKTEMIWSSASDILGGDPVGYANHFTVLSNGSILITDSSERHRNFTFFLSFLEFQSKGKLIIFNPEENKTHAILQGLNFANGLLLARDESYVLLAETGRARILRYYLKGPKAGSHDVFLSNLPGIPDNLSYSRRGTIWVPLATARHNYFTYDFLVENPWVRILLTKLRIDLEALFSYFSSYGLLLEVDMEGTILHSYHDPNGLVVSDASEVIELEDKMYIGSYKAPYIVEIEVPYQCTEQRNPTD